MEYYTLQINDKEYQCRLDARACVKVEKALGTNPLNVLAKVAASNELPSLETLMIILNASLQKSIPGLSLDKTYDIYDEYIASGKTLVELLTEIVEIFRVSGFFKEFESKN